MSGGEGATEREVMLWADLGTGARDLALAVADDGWMPDMILGIARGGLLVAGALGYALGVKNTFTMNVEFYTGAALDLVQRFCAGKVAQVRCAVLYEKPRSAVKCEYVWRRTDRWITFPW